MPAIVSSTKNLRGRDAVAHRGRLVGQA